MASKLGRRIKRLRINIHKTPVISGVAKGFAGTFGLGDTYDDFDRKNKLGKYKDYSEPKSAPLSHDIYGPPVSPSGQQRGFLTKLFALFTTGRFA